MQNSEIGNDNRQSVNAESADNSKDVANSHENEKKMKRKNNSIKKMKQMNYYNNRNNNNNDYLHAEHNFSVRVIMQAAIPLIKQAAECVVANALITLQTS